MSVLKRPIGRRVTGVGVGVALMVLGLAAPAMANTTVTAVSPTSGPTDCVVDITGTGFRTFPDGSNTLTFVGPAGGAGDDVNAAEWFSISDTEIWAVVPTLVAGTTYSVVLTQPSGTNTAGGTFLSTGATSAGGCAPTIASFTPSCGTAGDVVTITGTNLLSAANLSSANSGGDVFFQDTTPPTMALATQPVPDLSEPTSISAIVPSGVADGPIQVLTDVDTNPTTAGVQGVFSTTSFLTPPPDCTEPTGNEHARGVTLTLKKHLVARGVVSLTDAEDTMTECVAGVPVKIQRRKGGSWKGVGTATTNDSGAYKVKIKDKAGKYRAKAKKVELNDGADICLKAISSTAKHSH